MLHHIGSAVADSRILAAEILSAKKSAEKKSGLAEIAAKNVLRMTIILQIICFRMTDVMMTLCSGYQVDKTVQC